MELTEQIQSINQQLIDLFGIDTISGLPLWRIVFSEDQYEKRLVAYTDTGLQLLYPEVRLVPKYRQWIQEKYVLEQLTIIPDINTDELPSTKLTYEPIYVFESQLGHALPPKIQVAKFVIDSVYAARGKSSLAKYVDSSVQEEEIKKLHDELFGNETEVGDALAYGQGVVVPSNYKKED